MNKKTGRGAMVASFLLALVLALGEAHFYAHQAGAELELDKLAAEAARRWAGQLRLEAGAAGLNDRRLFAAELLRLLHEQHAAGRAPDELKRQSGAGSATGAALSGLLGAIGAEGDARRLVDWVQNSFNLASVGELTTQFVVSKLGSVNCAALLKPDPEETLVPRFLLFNERFVDVPFELRAAPTANECLAQGAFDPARKTAVLVHGYLAGYTLVDGLTNIKNRLLDLNRRLAERALANFRAEGYANASALPDELELAVRQQQYNVLIVDWFNGANPQPRSRYIRAAVNAQVVGQLIARFLSALVVQCRAPAAQMHIIAHSLGCHVAGFTGKALRGAGHKLGKITHLDPIGLCFGRLFSEARFRLAPSDALETHAVHVSLNLFDNPLDGAQANFLVNGGRDQAGCGGQQSELQNSTSSSLALLYDPEAKFRPCSHMRAVSLFEDDLSSEPQSCQIVGYKCASYERFLAGKCGRCDELNRQCRLMSLPPLFSQVRRVVAPAQATPPPPAPLLPPAEPAAPDAAEQSGRGERPEKEYKIQAADDKLSKLVNKISNGSIAWVIEDQELNEKIGHTIAKMHPKLVLANAQETREQLKNSVSARKANAAEQAARSPQSESYAGEYPKPPSLRPGDARRADRRLGSGGARLAQTLDKLRADTRTALAEGWTSLVGAGEAKYKVSSLIKAPFAQLQAVSAEVGAVQLPVQAPLQVAAAAAPSQPAEFKLAEELEPAAPLGSQALPAGSSNMPIYFVGTGAISPYCVNYYQVRILIAEARVKRLLLEQRAGQAAADARLEQRQAQAERNKLHLTVKLTDSAGHFFKGFTLAEDARGLAKLPIESKAQRQVSSSENMLELTMLLNSTAREPVRVAEAVVSYYFHKIVLADLIEVNYMSNISPQVRASRSSLLCPLAINDKHQLVSYVDCHRLPGAAAAARRR